MLKLQSQEAEGKRPSSFILDESPSTGLEATGGGGRRKGLSMKEKPHRDLLLFLFKSNYRKHKHMEKSSPFNHPEIMMF